MDAKQPRILPTAPAVPALCQTEPMTIVLIAIAAYLLAAGLLVAQVARDSRTTHGWLLPAVAGVVLHAAHHVRDWQVAGGADLHFYAALSLAGLGMAIAGIPFAGLLTAAALILCIAQLGPGLILIPAVIWLYWSGQTGSGTFLLLWSVLAITIDNVVRPMFVRVGADLPLLLIIAGVTGGLLSMGIVGLFVGPVVLAVTWRLFEAWSADGALSPAVSGTEQGRAERVG